MAELFIELFSEEIPSKLQIDARQKIKQLLQESLQKKEITFNYSQSFSTPKRLVFLISGIPDEIKQKGKILKGPKVDPDDDAIVSVVGDEDHQYASVKVLKRQLQ